jgi:hypothetical protein
MQFFRVAVWILFTQAGVFGQTAIRIYVEPFASNTGDSLREALIKLLKGQKEVSVAAAPGAADRVLTGTNRTYIKGYLSRNPRVRYRNGDSRPVYAGYVSVELKDQQDETVWSYLVTPARFGSEDISKNLGDQIVSKLLQFLANPTKAP